MHVREHRGESQLRWMAARSPYVLKRPPRPRPTNPTQFGRAGARTTCDSCLWGCTKCRARAFHVLAVWMVAEGYLGQLEAAETNNRRRRTRLDNNVESDSSSNLETDSSTSSTSGADEMMQGAATDPLSSPEVVTNRHHCASQHHHRQEPCQTDKVMFLLLPVSLLTMPTMIHPLSFVVPIKPEIINLE